MVVNNSLPLALYIASKSVRSVKNVCCTLDIVSKSAALRAFLGPPRRRVALLQTVAGQQVEPLTSLQAAVTQQITDSGLANYAGDLNSMATQVASTISGKAATLQQSAAQTLNQAKSIASRMVEMVNSCARGE